LLDDLVEDVEVVFHAVREKVQLPVVVALRGDDGVLLQHFEVVLDCLVVQVEFLRQLVGVHGAVFEGAALSVDRSTADGSSATTVELANFGNADLTDVEVAASAGGEVVGRELMAAVDPGATSSVSVDISGSVDEPVTYTASYTAAGTTHTTSVTGQSSVSGEIRLTGVEATRSGTSVTLQGDAANVGSTDTESVLLSVVDADGTSTASPSGEYFVGAIDASEFATFELTADAAADASSLPVNITYLVDGERVTKTQVVDVASGNGTAPAGQAAAASGQAPGDSGGPAAGGPGGQQGPGGMLSTGLLGNLPLTEIGVVLALVVVGAIGFAVHRWRNP